MSDAGYRLKKARLDLGLTFRDVERASDALASSHHCAEYFLPISRLAEIENHAALPTIFRVYALSAIYHLHFDEILLWYDIDLSQLSTEVVPLQPLPADPQTRLLASGHDHWIWDQSRTPNGEHKPLTTASRSSGNICYARVGSEDRTMDPLIPPGTVVRIDTSLRRVLEWAWRNEFERPIYLVEHSDGYSCSWCSLHHKTLVLEPHPLSSCSPRTYRVPQQAEVRGQVIGVAISLRPISGPPLLPPTDPTRS
jgi:transcriptional regulator with XRE-family HTH domain